MNVWTSFFIVFSAVAVIWPFLSPGESGPGGSDGEANPEINRNPLEDRDDS